MSLKHFLNTQDWSRTDLDALLTQAALFKRNKLGDQLKGKSIALVFFNPSMRTRTSFELGAFQLGTGALQLVAKLGIGLFQLLQEVMGILGVPLVLLDLGRHFFQQGDQRAEAALQRRYPMERWEVHARMVPDTWYHRLLTLTFRGYYSSVEEYEVSERYRRSLRTKANNVDQGVSKLSGGNQQKVVLAKWMFTDPDILILDEPTRGIDVGAKFEIYGIIQDLAAQGKGVILISSELPELLGLSDRIYTIFEGAITNVLTAAEADPESLMVSMTSKRTSVR